MPLCSQFGVLGYRNTGDRYFLTQNLILAIFNLYIYKSRGSANLSFNTFFHNLLKTKNLEKSLAFKY